MTREFTELTKDESRFGKLVRFTAIGTYFINLYKDFNGFYYVVVWNVATDSLSDITQVGNVRGYYEILGSWANTLCGKMNY